MHTRIAHNSTITREAIKRGTKIIASASDPRRLGILEALYILNLHPELNAQTDFVMLPTLKPRIRPSENVQNPIRSSEVNQNMGRTSRGDQRDQHASSQAERPANSDDVTESANTAH